MGFLEEELLRMQHVGVAIAEDGFTYDKFFEIAKHFWTFLFQTNPDVDSETIGFADEETLFSYMVLNNQQYYTKLYHALPELVQQEITQELFVSYFSHIPQQAYEENGGVIGNYNALFDKCYILEDLEDVEDISITIAYTSIGIHELAHRFLHKRRKEFGLDSYLTDPDLEEQYALYVEELFVSWAFGIETYVSPGYEVGELSIDSAYQERKNFLSLYRSLFDYDQLEAFHQNLVYEASDMVMNFGDDLYET